MTCAILLAAGRSRRMGTQKLLLPFRGSTVIAHIADHILSSPVARTFVVTGPDPASLAAALAGRPVALVTNPDPAGDMLSSVRCGLRALPPDCRDVLVALGDQPSLTSDLIVGLLRAFDRGPHSIAVPVYGGRRGHPLVFSFRYCNEILTCHDDEGLRGLLRAHPDDVLEVPVSTPWVLADMDCPDDYRRELTRPPEADPP